MSTSDVSELLSLGRGQSVEAARRLCCARESRSEGRAAAPSRLSVHLAKECFRSKAANAISQSIYVSINLSIFYICLYIFLSTRPARRRRWLLSSCPRSWSASAPGPETVNICIYIYMCVYIYIYTHIHREREREKEREILIYYTISYYIIRIILTKCY